MTLPRSTHGYIARKGCGCIVALMVDAPDCAKEIARCVREGLTLERKTVEECRADGGPWIYDCPHKEKPAPAPKQADLFSAVKSPSAGEKGKGR